MHELPLRVVVAGGSRVDFEATAYGFFALIKRVSSEKLSRLGELIDFVDVIISDAPSKL